MEPGQAERGETVLESGRSYTIGQHCRTVGGNRRIERYVRPYREIVGVTVIRERRVTNANPRRRTVDSLRRYANPMRGAKFL